MPALPDVPSVLRVDQQWSFATDANLITRLFFKYSGGAPADADLVTMAADIATAWVANVKPLTGEETYYQSTTVTDLTSPTSAQGTHSGAAVGTRGGGILPSSTAVLFNYSISRRYRGGKPRSYVPLGATSDLLSAREWEGASVTAFLDGWGSFITDIVAMTPGPATITDQVNVSYYGPPNRLITGSTGRVKTISTMRADPIVDTITGISCSSIPANQRRRSGQKR